MNFFLCFFIFIIPFTIQSVQPSQELISLAQVTNKDEKLNQYLSKFPFKDYDVCKVEGLGQFYVDRIDDSIKTHLRQGIYWESTIGIILRLFAKPNSIVLDIGAHIGIHTITLSKKVGPKGLVVAFEPQNKIFRELKHNLKLNQCTQNVILLKNALGDSSGLIEMDVRSPQNEGGTSIGQGGDQAWMVTLDSLKLNNVSLIKLDVESYEMQVFLGGRETLVRNRPVIIFEILGNNDLDNCPKQIKEKYDAILSFLDSLDYNVQRIWGNDFIATPRGFFNY